MKSLSIQDLIDDKRGGAVFVLNTSEKKTRGGDVFITVQIGDTNRPIRVPKTWIPIEVTRMVPRESLLKSSYFMEAVSSELIQVITAEDAAKLARTEGYAEEVERLKAREEAVRTETRARGIGKNVIVTSQNGAETEDENIAQGARKQRAGVSMIGSPDDNEQEPTVSATFVAWVNKLNQVSAMEALNTLRARRQISYEECEHLVANCTHPKVVGFVKRRMG